jgi:hypothetical protein
MKKAFILLGYITALGFIVSSPLKMAEASDKLSLINKIGKLAIQTKFAHVEKPNKELRTIPVRTSSKNSPFDSARIFEEEYGVYPNLKIGNREWGVRSRKDSFSSFVVGTNPLGSKFIQLTVNNTTIYLRSNYPGKGQRKLIYIGIDLGTNQPEVSKNSGIEVKQYGMNVLEAVN